MGIFPFIIDSATNGHIGDVLFRSGQLPSVFGLIITSIVLLILVYVQGIHIDIPIVSTKYRGFTAVYPIKLLYTSNIPVILSSALLANAVFMGQMLWANYNPQNDKPCLSIGWLSLIQARPQTPTGGVLYYITSPKKFRCRTPRSRTSCSYVVFLTDYCNCFR